MTTLTPDQLTDLIGPVAVGEYNAATPADQVRLDAWIGKLRDLTDADLFRDTKYRIYESANCGRFQGNFEDVHCMASAVYHEAVRRHHAAGHREDCRGPMIYSRAYNAVMRDQGFATSPDGVCTCEGLR